MLRHHESRYTRRGMNTYPASHEMNCFGTEQWLRRIASHRVVPGLLVGVDSR